MANRRPNDQEPRRRLELALHGLALICIIQLLISLHASRYLVGTWLKEREQETKRFDRMISEDRRAQPGEGHHP
ncbi:MAG: hypothetical protein HY815_23225 [Candidatus Riflebacteria bacterium]|nr:hypothetical protein [Candidatus Riflebacteria bacterium]